MPERLDKATRRREPVRAFLHYVDRLAKAKRRGTSVRAGAPRPAQRVDLSAYTGIGNAKNGRRS